MSCFNKWSVCLFWRRSLWTVPYIIFFRWINLLEILCYKNREFIDIIDILHFYENSTSGWYEGWSQLQFETFLSYEIVQTAKILEKNGFSFQDFWRYIYLHTQFTNMDLDISRKEGITYLINVLLYKHNIFWMALCLPTF